MPASLVYDAMMTELAGDAPPVNFITGFFKLLLVNGYSPNQGSDATRADVSDETTGTGYTAGGLPATLGVALDEIDHTMSISMQNVVWAGSNTFSATGAVLYQSYGGGPSGDPLVCYIDFGGTVNCVDGSFTVAPVEPIEFINQG